MERRKKEQRGANACLVPRIGGALDHLKALPAPRCPLLRWHQCHH